jgi:hypothetical protein
MMRGMRLVLTLVLLAGCVAAPPPADPLAGLRTESGTVLWQQEYEFVPPPAPWKLMMLNEDDYSIAFFRGCGDEPPGNYPCESTFAYAEEPFGYSRELLERQREFFRLRRFLWAARVDFDPPKLEKISALGGEGLLAETVGHERVLGHKVLALAVFARRGERVVAFYFTQWRPGDGDFDRGQLENFRRFVETFRFRQPSFYERLSGPR